VRHDAERTPFVAPLHHRHEGGRGFLAGHCTRTQEPGRLDVEAGQDALRAAELDLLEGLRNIGDAVGPDDEIDLRQPLQQSRAFLLGHTTCHGNDELGTSPLQHAEPAHLATQLLLGFLADGAGVQQNQIGVVGALASLVAGGLQELLDAFRVVLVHLTPEGD
jgi:hypothetical protein